MSNRKSRTSLLRLFGTYALISLLPVLVLGFALAANYRSAARDRGIAEGRSEAIIVARTAVEPLLGGRPLSDGVTATEKAGLRKLVARAVAEKDVLRLRLRDLAGNVVFSDDGSGFGETPEDEALDAAHGTVVARLTKLNSDANDSGAVGPESVEVYVPLSDADGQRVGVLEIYLPYAPINADVSAELDNLYRDLAAGLGLLYLVLFAISASIGHGLRRESARNAFLAEHDPLTLLPNRALFHRRVEEAVRGSVRHNVPLAIAIIDLDRFKEVNDTLGHLNGDHLLAELAGRLSSEIRPGDTVARLGGDEFGVVLRNAADPETALRRLREVIDREILVGGLPITVEASVGYASVPEDGTDVDELLQRADVAMYLAKAQRVGVMRYDRDQDHYDAAKLGLLGELRHAIDDGQLVLHYQPKSNLSNQAVETVEALVRWNHPDQGLLMPDSFIPLAEQTDLIFGLTEWVIHEALREVRSFGPDVAVAVNVSARSLTNVHFPDMIAACLEQHDLPSDRLIVEVTETALITDPPRAIEILEVLSARGIRISLDDYGSGQTSLTYLASLPLHELKIDRSFVTDMLVNPAHSAIVRSIVDLGHDLSFRVVAEGVETAVVLDALAKTGCDDAQGYFLARPMPASRLVEWFASQRSVTHSI